MIAPQFVESSQLSLAILRRSWWLNLETRRVLRKNSQSRCVKATALTEAVQAAQCASRRLLQQNRHKADMASAQSFDSGPIGLWDNPQKLDCMVR
jgi:hypothetical protein